MKLSACVSYLLTLPAVQDQRTASPWLRINVVIELQESKLDKRVKEDFIANVNSTQRDSIRERLNGR